jgi:hypothetical protein
MELGEYNAQPWKPLATAGKLSSKVSKAKSQDSVRQRRKQQFAFILGTLFNSFWKFLSTGKTATTASKFVVFTEIS